jgi:hypothetical protein
MIDWMLGAQKAWQAGAVVFFSKIYDDPLIAFTALLAIATVSLVLVVLCQVRDARRSSERQLRAYVFIESVLFAQPDTPTSTDEPWRIHIVFKNYGQTPAYSTVVKATDEFGHAKPDDVLLKLPANAQIIPETAIPPGQIHTIRLSSLRGGLRAYVAAREARKCAYVWGRVDYIDTFGRPHFQTFQMVSDFGQIHQFVFCQNGNGSDDRFRSGWWRRRRGG